DFMPLVRGAEAESWLDRYVTQQAIAQLKEQPHLQLSINLSQRIVEDRFIAEDIYDLLAKDGVHAHQLHFEISEASLAHNFQDAVALIRDLKDLGCAVILDNFANRHLTFLQWEKLAVDAVKLDPALSGDLQQDSPQTRLATAIIDTSVSLGQPAIAKSVDAYSTFRHLLNLSVDSAQGYHLQPPSHHPWIRSKVEILGVPIDNITQEDLLKELKSGIVFSPTVDHLMQLRHDQAFHEAYNIADYKICDSQTLYFSSQFLGSPLQEKISSSDLLTAFYTYHQDNPDIKIYLLAAAPGVAAEAQQHINTVVGREMVVGAYTPAPDFDENPQEGAAILERIHRSGATVLVMSMGSPQQEQWIYRYHKQLSDSIKIILALGTSLDIAPVAQEPAPQGVSSLNLAQWFNLMGKAGHLGKRYLMKHLPFMWLILNQRLRH
ncbi:MAG: EAL domain-containing protein, partial [Acaryochloris sp. SU_5_25]|nr:EAL domain-containing protein [Acaryochloris sp. SU_5_25]